ncbi:peptidoglycan-recognition protein LC-like [Leptidea sinapis]|uniref:peptidoglycan-recognition protein LC-like n=1 Tax=Leptidea sinapis TaxID=189913 RepID=UPI002123E8ED|nr:peptidoglycan-recognition protein LC-like [Leptidea sinapis]
MATIYENSQCSSLKIEGHLGDLQVTEVSSDSEEETCDIPDASMSSKTLCPGSLSTFPQSLVQTSVTPVVGNVSVSDSENVQFGNNTYFNGPVTIKQIVHEKSGVENVSYSKTEEELHNGTFSKNPHLVYAEIKKNGILMWHKLTFSLVCIAIIAGIVAVVVILQNTGDTQKHSPLTEFDDENGAEDSLIISSDYQRIVSRSDWLAQPVESPLDKIRQPIPWVIITHTATESCSSQSQCVLRVRLIQNFHIESRGWSDIGYNFLVGGDGSVYFGRGWDYIGAHTQGYNKYSIGIAFIGTYNTENPVNRQIEACQKIIRQGVRLGKLAKDYKLFAHRQLMSTLSPGDTVYDIVKTWPHFVKNVTDINNLIPNY